MHKKKTKEKTTTYSDVALIELFDHNVFISPNRKSALCITRPDYLGTHLIPKAIFNFSITPNDDWHLDKVTELVSKEIYDKKGEGIPFLYPHTRNGKKIELSFEDVTGLISDTGKHHLLNFPRTKIGDRKNAGCYIHSFCVEDQFWISRIGYDETGICNYVSYGSYLNTHPLLGEYLLIAYGDACFAELIILNEWLKCVKKNQLPKMVTARFKDTERFNGGRVATWFEALIDEFHRTDKPFSNENLIIEELI